MGRIYNVPERHVVEGRSTIIGSHYQDNENHHPTSQSGGSFPALSSNLLPRKQLIKYPAIRKQESDPRDRCRDAK